MLIFFLPKYTLVFLGIGHLGKNYFLNICYKMSYRSYCITVRPREGITDRTSTEIVKWLSKCEYSFAVLEMEEESRHLHAQIWLDKPRARGDICKQIQRVCERTIDDWDNPQLKVLRQGVKIGYSDWYLDYLAENELKDTPPNILLDNPPSKTMDFYPTEEEQDNIQSLKTAVDPRFCRLEIDFLEWLGERSITHNTVCKFLAEAMFVNRTIKVILQHRDRKALGISLYAYVNKSADIYLFKDKDKFDLQTEKLLSEHNIQGCQDGETESEGEVEVNSPKLSKKLVV